MATLNSVLRSVDKEQKEIKKTASQAAKQGRALTSNEGLSSPEPATEVGMKPQQGGGYARSVSGGRHHGVMLNIADSVGYSIAQAESDRGGSYVQKASASLDRAYTHLGMHHSAHLMGNHEAAAGHLAEAGKHLASAMSSIGGELKGGVSNAFGEKHRRPDLEATIEHAVSHYATHHGVTVPNVSGSKKRKLTPDVQPVDTPGVRSGTANLGRDISMGRDVTHALGGQQLEEYRQKVAAAGANPDRSTGLESLSKMPPTMTRKQHILQAHSDLMNKGKIHPRQLAALKPHEVDELHEITGVPKPRDTRSTSLPEAPMPKDREL
jgi:hypothetical protein